ncbi:benzoate 4-monooxygenase cytochrome P450 [Decorospora gaudefroyi]|uniref:Benzoate 4-monooxygenase cytochrome P450 n=1 Tax=Decorospora gaudefroyi TaxID=184978 RepID=A0A6A5KL80_9PLEO|nr:benzoate 4-monooxygenase cytochrome P450 [Decorospora gaudefroyi]
MAAGFVVVVTAYWLGKAIYNLYFHPLAKFPGPRWAAASYLAEFYYDVLCGGQYFKKVIQMHERYGPLVRINPHELSFDDPIFYDKVYAGGGHKREKDAGHAAMSGMFTATISTVDHDLHRQRRGYVANFFSKKSIHDLEPLIQKKVDILVERLKEAYHSGQTLVGVLVFGSLAADIITHYAYGESFEELNKPGFPCELERGVKGLLLSLHARRYFPAMGRFLSRLPKWVLARMQPDVVVYVELDAKVEEYSKKALKKREAGDSSAKAQTLFDALVDPHISAPEKTIQRLKDESFLILFAGLDTTARFLTVMVCCMATYPNVLAKLRAELRSLTDTLESKPTWSQLEALPYLTAFINESLRFQCNFTGRFPRVPLEPLVYKDWVIPPRTTIGAIPHLLLNHPDIFPEPKTFRPERWLEAKARGEYLDRYLITFTKGSRACLGINLAYAELYLSVAALVQNFEMELVDSSIENIIPYRDMGLAFDKEYNFGVNFKISKVLQG